MSAIGQVSGAPDGIHNFPAADVIPNRPVLDVGNASKPNAPVAGLSPISWSAVAPYQYSHPSVWIVPSEVPLPAPVMVCVVTNPESGSKPVTVGDEPDPFDHSFPLYDNRRAALTVAVHVATAAPVVGLNDPTTVLLVRA